MSWFPFRGPRKDREPAGRSGVATQVEVEPEIHRSLALPTLFDAMSRRPKLNLLDLGSAVGSNVEYLSQFGCKLTIEDLYASRSAEGAGELGPDFFSRLLAVPEGTLFDIVFAWDLYNYLSRKELGYLAAELRRLCRPGALVFALIWIHKTIPAQPIRFRIQSPDQLLYERRTAVERPGPRFAPAELNQAMAGFQVDRSFLLRHGIQEYLFIKD